ncbi:MAG: hypothetical protein V3W20_11030, partial [Candidatus Neomarinimicrobiota bacterium]
MKKTMKLILAILVIVLFIPSTSIAQDNEEPNTVLCVKIALDWKEGASVSEGDSIYALWDNNVTKKNKYIKMHMRINHFYGSNSEDG